VTGQLQTDWRLDMSAPYALQGARNAGDPLLVTVGTDGLPGVEVRTPDLDLDATGRIEAPGGSLASAGWNRHVASLAIGLHLPPGHRLLAAIGADNAPSAWVERWRLLDLFAVLLVSVIAFRVAGTRAAALSFAGLVLAHQGVPLVEAARDDVARRLVLGQDWILVEEPDPCASAQLDSTDVGWLVSCEHAKEARLSCAVATDDADAASARDGRVDAGEERLCSVGFFEAIGVQDRHGPVLALGCVELMSIAVLINAHARKGSEQLGDRIRGILPDAAVRVTRSADEARRWIMDLSKAPPRFLLSGGGDGTAVSLLNMMREHALAVEAVGLLPFGTGNAWARTTSAVDMASVLDGVATLGRTESPPTRSCALVEVDGTLTPFAGAGWDAEILADHAAWRRSDPWLFELGGPSLGYARSVVARTIPRGVRQTAAHVRLVNLGEPALRVDARGETTEVPDAGPGAVLYEGPFRVGGASTTEELGLGFRAFSFGRGEPTRLAVRIFSGSAIRAVLSLPTLWRGGHVRGEDHRFLLTRCRFEFDREMPYETGGDLAGTKRTLEMRVAPNAVDLVDFRALSSVRSRRGW